MTRALDSMAVQSMTLDRERQTRIGLGLAAAILGTWIALHVWAVFFFPWQKLGPWAGAAIAVPTVALLCWLYVGMFIVAHDCMHGSLAPFRPALNRAIGRLCLFLYAGFDFDRLNPKHHLHHRHSGTGGDPDFDERPPHGFWRWYAKFFAEYFSGRELLIIMALTIVYQLVGASLTDILLFWALPAILSSLQLFTFGTYLPHVPDGHAFADRHNARSNDFSWLWSLLTCFHFGYHHEHHLLPGVPWWRLPAAHAELRSRS